MKTNEVKLILLQTRPDAMRDHEYRCVLQTLDIRPSQLKQIDAFEQRVTPDILKGYDGVISGGDGAHSVLDLPDFLEPVKDVLMYCYKNDFPLIGICFGFQLLSMTLGGRVVDDSTLKELATVPLSLTNEGMRDPIFQDIPAEFVAISAHNQSVLRLPETAVRLCTGPQPIEYAARFNDHVWGTQFHMDLDDTDVATRLRFYMSKYVDGNDDGAFDRAMSRITPIGPVKKMLTNFVAALH